MITFTRQECTYLGRSIENEIKKRFGWNLVVTVKQDGSLGWKIISGKDRYDLYPGLTKEEADNAIMEDIQAIIRAYIPGFCLTDYYQSGKWHYE